MSIDPSGIAAFTAELQRIRTEREAAEKLVVAQEDKPAEPIVESRPADEVKPVEEPTKAAPTFKAIAVNETEGVIIGIGAYADLVDLDDEVVNKSDLVNMSYAFCASSERKFKANHREDIACDLVASWPGAPMLQSGAVLKKGEPIPIGDPVVGISLEKGAETAWFIAVRPHDKSIADKAREGGVAGFSWSGVVTRTPKE